jgi:hypothetical protein
MFDNMNDLVATALTARVAPRYNLCSATSRKTLTSAIFCVSPLTACLRLHNGSQEDASLIDSITFWRRLTFCQPELAEVKLWFVREAAKDEDISFIFIVPCIIIFYLNNQQMQLYAVNFISLLFSL